MDDQNILTLKALQNESAQILTDYFNNIENVSIFVLRKHEIIKISFANWLAHVIAPSITTLTGFMEYISMKKIKNLPISPEDTEKLSAHHIAYKTAITFFLSFAKIPETYLSEKNYQGTKDNPVPYPELSRHFFHELFFFSPQKENNKETTIRTAKLLKDNTLDIEKKVALLSSSD